MNPPTCSQSLSAHVRQDQGLVLVCSRAPGHLDERGGRVPAELGVDGPEGGVRVQHDLVGGQGDQRTAAHRVVGHDGGHVSVVVCQRRCDLACRDDHPARGVEDDLDRPAGGCLVDGAQDALGVVDVYVAHEREPEQRQRLLAVDEGDHGHAAPARDRVQRPPSLGEQHLARDGGLERREDEEQPQQAERVHGGALSDGQRAARGRSRRRGADRAPSPARPLRRRSTGTGGSASPSPRAPAPASADGRSGSARG